MPLKFNSAKIIPSFLSYLLTIKLLQEIAHYKWLLENHTHQSREENMLFVGEQTQSLVMEVTALRSKVADLHQQLGKKVLREPRLASSYLHSDSLSLSLFI